MSLPPGLERSALQTADYRNRTESPTLHFLPGLLISQLPRASVVRRSSSGCLAVGTDFFIDLHSKPPTNGGRMLSGQTANTTVVRTKTAAGTASAFGSYRPEQSSPSLYHGISIRSAILTARSVTSCCCTVARDWPVSGAKAALLNCGI